MNGTTMKLSCIQQANGRLIIIGECDDGNKITAPIDWHFRDCIDKQAQEFLDAIQKAINRQAPTSKDDGHA